MDKGDDSEGLSRKTGLFMDKADDSEGLSIKTALFMDKGARLTVSGLEAVTVDIRQSNFTNVGERTNVAGSRKFARLISEGKYDEALQIAARQIEDGATIIDINMDDAMLDSTREMERFVRHISNDPAVAKAALMIDSSHWETIEAGLKNAQGKCIVNSISLKEGPEQFIEKAKAIKSLGAAVVIMAFDEKGQATTFDRKIEICSRAYRILTEEAGLSPENIIFDANILSIGTGIEEHSKYAIDFIEAVRWIKTNLPGALTSGGVSNLSFSFRGNNAVREAMHSAFLYHAVKAGLDMAIVNPSMLQIYDEIEPELLRCVEDVIFDRDPQATERLIDKAARMMAEKETGNQDSTGKMMEKEAGNQNSTAKAEQKESSAEREAGLTPGERLKAALIKGRSETLAEDLEQAIYIYGKAVNIIEGPLMEGMETVGKMFGEGKMFLPQVVKSAKVMRDAVEILQPYMDTETAQSGNSKVESCSSHIEAADSTAESDGSHIEAADSGSGSDRRKAKPKITLATVKGDVHDIGKNITGIVLTCNGFQVNDLGVMVDKETILRASDESSSDIIAVSGLITPSLYQMEELCREMAERNMTKPLFVGGATTSALHTAVKLAPLYGHVFHGPDASSAAVMAKKYMMDPAGFEAEEHKKQEEIRKLYYKQEDTPQEYNMEDNSPKGFGYETYPDGCPTDIPAQQIPSEEVLQYFDWKMFYAIWGVKYGSSSMEAMELVQLRRDAEEEIALGNFRIMLSARFFPAYTENDDIVLVNGRNSAEAGLDSHGGNRTGSEWKRIPMMRQEKGDRRSLCDYIIAKESGRTSPLGCFAISVHAADAHEEGCCCPACSNKYEDLIGKAVRMTLAEAASTWLDKKILQQMQQDVTATDGCSRNSDETVASKVPLKVIKPAAGYSSCPDHSLKRDILELLGETTCRHHSHEGHSAAASNGGQAHHSHGPHCTCGCHHDEHTHDHSHTEGHVHSHTEGHTHGQETGALKIRLTETCAMTPEASICGTIFIHPEARYPEIRSISQEQHDSYIARRGMNEDTARRFLSHLLK
jgi:5-methyltetrahydrofolate--homocysteine methyltransferase